MRATPDEIHGGLPFGLLGLDSDIEAEFINRYLLRSYHQSQLQWTQGQPHQQLDNTHVKQKRRSSNHHRSESVFYHFVA